MTDILEYLRGNAYPGRGILIGSDRVYYFIMGRSRNSRNRVFEATPDGVRTKAFDEKDVEDPSLILYTAARTVGGDLVVTNGDQTDTIAEAGDFIRALRTREYEPDAPNYTPRISAVLRRDGSFALSILKRAGERCARQFFEYEGAPAGTGYFISTYERDGDPLPPFRGEPIETALPDPRDVWEALDPDNKVALYANVNGRAVIFNRRMGD